MKGDAIPASVREIGESFNTVLAFRDPTQRIVYENYTKVRERLAFLKEWINQKLADISSGKTPNPERTFAYYWMKNAEEGEYFAHRDVVFEVFHNFVALSQWGNTIYNIMLKPAEDTGDPDARAWFKKTMQGAPDNAAGNAFTPPERFVMELFCTINPNGGSISAIEGTRTPPFERHGYMVTPHKPSSFDPVHWKNPEKLRPGPLYRRADQSPDRRGQMRGDRLCEMSLRPNHLRRPRRPRGGNPQQRLRHRVRDRRWQAAAGLRLRGLCAIWLRVPPLPRRAADDLRSSKTSLRKVWESKIEFHKLDIPNPEPLPIGPTTVIGDDVGFSRAA